MKLIAEQVTQYVTVCSKWAMLSDKKVESRKWTLPVEMRKGCFVMRELSKPCAEFHRN